MKQVRNGYDQRSKSALPLRRRLKCLGSSIPSNKHRPMQTLIPYNNPRKGRGLYTINLPLIPKTFDGYCNDRISQWASQGRTDTLKRGWGGLGKCDEHECLSVMSRKFIFVLYESFYLLSVCFALALSLIVKADRDTGFGWVIIMQGWTNSY